MIRLVLFDMGGVIIRIPSTKYYEYLNGLSGVPKKRMAKILEKDSRPLERGEINLAEFERRVGRDLGMKAAQVRWFTFFKSIAQLDMGVVRVIMSLEGNYQIAFLSNVDYWRYSFTVKHLLKSIVPLFDYGFASFMLGSVKPSQVVYRKVIAVTGLRPSEILFIDNDPRNIKGAKKLGIESLRFTSVKKLKLDLKRLGIKTKSV